LDGIHFFSAGRNSFFLSRDRLCFGFEVGSISDEDETKIELVLGYPRKVAVADDIMDAALRPPRTRRRQRGNAMATRARLVAVVGAFAPSFVDRVHIIGASHIVVVGASSDDDASLLRHSNRHRVDFMYTYGAPSTSSPHVSNPGNKCSELEFFFCRHGDPPPF
jgi:hypothetical protein